MGIIGQVLGTARRATGPAASTGRTRRTRRRPATARPARGGGLLSGLLRRRGL